MSQSNQHSHYDHSGISTPVEGIKLSDGTFVVIPLERLPIQYKARQEQVKSIPVEGKLKPKRKPKPKSKKA